MSKALAQVAVAKVEAEGFLNEVYGRSWDLVRDVEELQQLLLRWYFFGCLDTEQLSEPELETTYLHPEEMLKAQRKYTKMVNDAIDHITGITKAIRGNNGTT